MKEKWRPVSGTDGRYWVSDQGRVKSMYKQKAGRDPLMKIQSLPHGRKYVNIDQKAVQLSRLVASEFCPFDPNDGKFYVDHINGDITDNRASNLRWCTPKENANFELAKINRREAIKKAIAADPTKYKMREAHLSRRIKIVCLSTGQEFQSVTEAADFVGISASGFSRLKKKEDGTFRTHGLVFKRKEPS